MTMMMDNAAPPFSVITDQLVLFHKAAELSSWNQLAPLSQNQLGTEEERADGPLGRERRPGAL